MTDLMQASSLWSKMPPEARFWTVQEIHQAATKQRELCRPTPLSRVGDWRIEAQAQELYLSGKEGTKARLGFQSTASLVQLLPTPKPGIEWLRSLSPTLAAQNLNFALARANGETRRLYLMGEPGAMAEGLQSPWTVRSFDGPDYERIHNNEMTSRLLRLEEQGWQVPPARPASDDPRTRPATQEDILAISSRAALGIKVGDPIAPAGLYLDANSDFHAFMVMDSARIKDGSKDGLARGFLLSNTEVCGVRSWRMLTFLYRFVCGNHIIWGAEEVKESSFRHVGKVRDKIGASLAVTTRYAEKSAQEDEEKIRTAQSFILGATKEEVLDKLFGLKIAGRKILDAAFDACDRNYITDGSPASAWGMAQGLTRVSQLEPLTVDRQEIDKAAGKVLEIPF